MRCALCDFDDSQRHGTNNFVKVDNKTGRPTCQVCMEIVYDAISEFDTEHCTDEYKRKHNIRETKTDCGLFQETGREDQRLDEEVSAHEEGRIF